MNGARAGLNMANEGGGDSLLIADFRARGRGARRAETWGSVMAGLVPAIHAVRLQRPPKSFARHSEFPHSPAKAIHRVDGRDKAGHDGEQL